MIFRILELKKDQYSSFIVTRVWCNDVSSSVSYSTRNGTASEDVDYVKKDGILGFAPGETSKEIDVRTLI